MTGVKSNCLKVFKAPDSFSGMQWSDLEVAATTPLSIWKALGARVSVAVSVAVEAMMRRFPQKPKCSLSLKEWARKGV